MRLVTSSPTRLGLEPREQLQEEAIGGSEMRSWTCECRFDGSTEAAGKTVGTPIGDDTEAFRAKNRKWKVGTRNLQHQLRKLFDVIGVKSEPVDGIMDQIAGAPASVGNQDGQSGSHCLIDDQPPLFDGAGVDKGFCAGVIHGQFAVLLEAWQEDGLLETEVRNEMRESGAQWAVAEENQRPEVRGQRSEV